MTTTTTTTATAAVETPAGTTATELAVQTVGLTRRYGDRVAVDRLDLAIRPGIVTGFIGPNGAGKTTTMRMLLGLVRPTSGTATVLGLPLDQRARYLTRTSALIEGPAFYPSLTGRDNLRLLAALQPTSPAALDAALDRVDLADDADRRVRTYSLGMRQRLAIAATLMHGPDLVLLDEPANGLDPAGIQDFRQLMRNLAHDGTTVLLSSHNLAEIEHCCDDLAILRAGTLLFQGSLAQFSRHRLRTLRAVPERHDDLRRVHRLTMLADPGASLADGHVELNPDAVDAAELNRLCANEGLWLRHLAVVEEPLDDTFLRFIHDDHDDHDPEVTR